MSRSMARVFISAAHKSSGKTTVSIGLCAALAARGLAVQPFKKGPDYIDPLWLSSAAAGRACRNLDHNTMTPAEIGALFRRHAAGTDIAVIEGNKGLHDGIDLEGTDSSAALAELLRAPVVLVIDAGGITRGVAPLLLGLRDFNPGLRFAGVVLNKVAGARHEAKLRAAIERYTDIPVLGALPRSDALVIAERHLGLVPANEAHGASKRIAALGAAVAAGIDLDRLLQAASAAPPLRGRPPAPQAATAARGRVGVAHDHAFGFYYADDLDMLEAEGFAVVPFNAVHDPHLPPDLDGVFIGGGFPETQMDALEANASLRADIRAAVAGGMPVYAECGGLMYLSRSITWQGTRRAMVGALPGDAVMQARPQGKGLVRLRETGLSPWPDTQAGTIPGHEFHHAALVNLPPDTRFAYDVLRGHGITGDADGIVLGRTLAAFTHLRGVGPCPWPRRFAALMRSRAGSSFPHMPAGVLGLCPTARPLTHATPSAPDR
jgi:cobyrinic acid a,c-diamide synthase